MKRRLRALLDTLVDMITSRLDLAAAEAEDLAAQAGALVGCMLVGAITATIMLLFIGAALVLAAPVEYRSLGALGFAMANALALGWAGVSANQRWRRMQAPFGHLSRTLRKDLASLRSAAEEPQAIVDGGGHG